MNIDLEKYKKTGDFTLSSGKKSNYYYDLKEAMGESINLIKIVNQIEEKYHFDDIDVIVGIEYGGIPMAVGLSLFTGKPFAVLRKKPKEYGTGKRIEGYQKVGKALLVDDVKTTGGSLQNAKDDLTELGYIVVGTEVAYDRSE